MAPPSMSQADVCLEKREMFVVATLGILIVAIYLGIVYFGGGFFAVGIHAVSLWWLRRLRKNK
jgi:hypothetical protein